MENERINTTGNNEKREGGVTGKGFVKNDPRINRNGRPRTFDALRKEALKIATEIVKSPDGKISASRIHAVLLDWAASKDTDKQRLFIEYAYGKVPTQTEISGRDGGAIKIQGTHDYRVASAILAPGSMGDSETSGEDQGGGDGETLGENRDGD